MLCERPRLNGKAYSLKSERNQFIDHADLTLSLCERPHLIVDVKMSAEMYQTR